MSCGTYLKEERQLKRQILEWKKQQKHYRSKWLLLDLKINSLENKINDMVLNRTNKRCLTK